MEYNYEGVLTPAQIGGTTFKRTMSLVAGKREIPYYYAICASHNLQSCVLTSKLGEVTTVEAAVLGILPKGSGLRVLTAKKKKWLVIDWFEVGRTFLGIKTEGDSLAAEALRLFVTERHCASSIGPCEQKMVKEIDGRYKSIANATALDITAFFD